MPKPPSNKAPIPIAGGPYTAEPGTACIISAAGSTDPDNTGISKYHWQLLLGSTVLVNLETVYQVAAILAPAIGDYVLKLIVVDKLNASASVSTSFKSAAPEPPPPPPDPEEPPPPSTVDAWNQPLFQKWKMRVVGAFTVPTGPIGATNFRYTDQPGGGIAIDPDGGVMYLTANGTSTGGLNAVGTVKIPVARAVTRQTPLTSYAVAELLHDPIDLTEGDLATKMLPIASNGIAGGGLLLVNQILINTQYEIYGGSQKVTTTQHHKDLNVPGHFGPFNVGGNAGWTSGPMCLVPPEWRELLGSDVIASNTGIPIITRTSFGPCAVGYLLANFSQETPATYLLGYVMEAPFLDNTGQRWHEGSWPPAKSVNGIRQPWTESDGAFWNISHRGRSGAIAMFDGYRSYLHFGVIGAGDYVYGMGDMVNNPANPPVVTNVVGNGGLIGQNASTDSTGTHVTMPGCVFDQGLLNGEFQVWLSNQTTPVQNPTSNSARRPGCALPIAFFNSGQPDAYMVVDTPFPPNLTNQPFVVGKQRVWDPYFADQGNHAAPYKPICYAFDCRDMADVKAGRKVFTDIAPYAMWDLSDVLPEWLIGVPGGIYSFIKGGAWNKKDSKFWLAVQGFNDYMTFLELEIEAPSAS